MSRRHVLSAGTCPLPARVLSAHTDHKLRPWRCWFTLQHVVASFSAPARVLLTHTDSLLSTDTGTTRPLCSSSLFHSLSLSLVLLLVAFSLSLPLTRSAPPKYSHKNPPFTSRPALFRACSTSLRQSGADTPPSLVTVTGGFFFTPGENLGVIVLSAPNHRETFFLFFWRFWRETPADNEPRLGFRGKPRRVSIHPAGNVATRCLLVVGAV